MFFLFNTEQVHKKHVLYFQTFKRDYNYNGIDSSLCLMKDTITFESGGNQSKV